MADSVRLVIRALGAALLALTALVGTASGQNLTSSEETISVSTSAVGVTANLCGTDNTGGAWVQVITNGIYFTLNSATATPDSSDFTLNAGTTGPQFWVKPASKLRMLRQSADSNVKISCTD